MRLIAFLFFVCLGCNSNSTSEKVTEFVQQQSMTSKFNTVSFEPGYLAVTTFLNGDQIQQAQSANEWKKLCASKTPAWCYADEKNANGILYNYYVLMDPREILTKDKQLTINKSVVLNSELQESKQHLTVESNATLQRTFYGSNRNLDFVQFWIFDDSLMKRGKASVMVWDLKNKRFRIDNASMNNGFRIWALK